MDIKTCRIIFLITIVTCLLMFMGILPTHAATSKVLFYQQNSLGQVIESGAKGQLLYNDAGPTFNFNFTASKLDKGTSYTLILSREPEIILPARYLVIATGISDSRGNLSLTDSYKFDMDLLAGKMLLIPTDVAAPEALTDARKYLFADRTIKYDDTESKWVCGRNKSSVPPQSFDLVGLPVGEHVIDFSLYGIAKPEDLTDGTEEQPLTLFTLSELLESKPVLLVNGAFT